MENLNPMLILTTELAIQLRPELKALLGKDNLITPEFCHKFISLLPEEDEVFDNDPEGRDYIGDWVDYISWGYALTGNWEEMEAEGGEIWDAISEYEEEGMEF